MTHAAPTVRDSADGLSKLATLLQAILPARRGAVMQSAASSGPAPTLEQTFAVGPMHAAFAHYWEARFGGPIPAERLRAVLEPPVPIGTLLEFNKLMLMRDAAELEGAIDQLADHLQTGLRKLDSPTQLQLLEVSIGRVRPNQRPTLPTGESVLSLQTLVERGQKFPTIYADSPWPYENEASGVAAANYHRIMPIDDLCADPIDQFTHDNEPLYLWTTPAVLRESLGVSSDCSGPCEWFLVRLWRNPFP